MRAVRSGGAGGARHSRVRARRRAVVALGARGRQPIATLRGDAAADHQEAVVDLEVAQGPRQSLVVRPLRAMVGPFVARALAAVLDTSAIGAEVILDLSPAQGASPGSIDVVRDALQRATDRGVAVSVHYGPDALPAVSPTASPAEVA